MKIAAKIDTLETQPVVYIELTQTEQVNREYCEETMIQLLYGILLQAFNELYHSEEEKSYTLLRKLIDLYFDNAKKNTRDLIEEFRRDLVSAWLKQHHNNMTIDDFIEKYRGHQSMSIKYKYDNNRIRFYLASEEKILMFLYDVKNIDTLTTEKLKNWIESVYMLAEEALMYLYDEIR